MTDEEIIKALECCISANEGLKDCKSDCPLHYHVKCIIKLMKLSRDIINKKNAEIDILIRKKEALRDEIASLQAKNEDLTVELVGMRGACESYKMHYDNAQAEIKCLKTLIDLSKKTIDVSGDYLSLMFQAALNAKSETRKEFAEKLKQKQYLDKDNNAVISVLDVNEVLKEFERTEEE